MAVFTDDEDKGELSSGGFDDDIRGWINLFIEQKSADRVSKKTKKSYEDALESFHMFVEKHAKDNTMHNIGARFVNRFLIDYQSHLAQLKLNQEKSKITDEIKLKNYRRVIKQSSKKHLGKNDALFEILPEFENSLSHRLTVLKMFLKFISESNSDDVDYVQYFHKFTTIKKTEKYTPYLTTDEYDSLVDFIQEWHKTYDKGTEEEAVRNALLILLYLLTGARSEEVVDIKLKDISYHKEYGKKSYYVVRIMHGKGGKIREVAVEAEHIEFHINYLKNRLPSNDYYISSIYDKDGNVINKPYHPDSIRKFANFVMKKKEIDKTGLHTFRRGFATRKVISEKMDIAKASKILGNSINVLERYYLKHTAVMDID